MRKSGDKKVAHTQLSVRMPEAQPTLAIDSHQNTLYELTIENKTRFTCINYMCEIM